MALHRLRNFFIANVQKHGSDWTGTLRQNQERVMKWDQASRSNELVNGFAYPQDEAARAEVWTLKQVLLYRAWVVVPAAVSFAYTHEKGTTAEQKRARTIQLRMSATLYNPEAGTFYGKTSIPKTFRLAPKATDWSRYGAPKDTFIEFYFFAERINSQAPLQMVLDLHMTDDKYRLSQIGYLVCPLTCFVDQAPE